jgi:formylglycine-generating enzyme required for sulfatase activity
LTLFLVQSTSFSAVTAANDPADDMILIPAGTFIMGTGPESGKAGEDYGVDEEPRHTVHLKAFYINRYEVTVGEYKKYLNATGKKWAGDPDLVQQYSPETYFNPEERDRFPVDYISWFDADDYCQRKGERLPTEEEWEKAARGTDGRMYAWGNQYDPQKTNSEDAGFGRPAPVGTFHEDKSPFGLYDVSANLLEWTSSRYLPYEGNTLKDNRWTTHANAYVLKGGSFLLPGKLFARPARRSIAYPAYAHRMHGFRCAKDASP